jgi:hypothetical protein
VNSEGLSLEEFSDLLEIIKILKKWRDESLAVQEERATLQLI